MAPLLLLLNATKILGVAGVIAVAVDSIAYRAYRKRNLAPFDSPINEDDEVLARFAIDTDEEEGGFFFSLATAPAHVEDRLHDSWLEFAEQDAPKQASSTGEPEIRQQPAESTGISLVEEQQAAKIFEAKTKDVAKGEEGDETAKEYAKPDSSRADAPAGNVQATRASGSRSAGEGGSPDTPTSGVTLSEWEVVSDGSDKDKVDDSNGSPTPQGDGEETSDELNVNTEDVTSKEEARGLDKDTPPELQLEDAFPPFPASMETSPGAQLSQDARRSRKNTTATIQFNLPRKAKQLGQVAMEAMLRGIDKVSEAVEDSSPNVAAWQNAFQPAERLRFWSEPDTEIKLARDANVTVFRMGIDWSRIMPIEPVNDIAQAVNWEAVKRYRYIIERVREHGMRVMLTLFHHSLPKWAARFGGWKNEKTLQYFVEFTRLAVDQYADLVDFWITLNEPHVFAMMTYCAGAWPGGDPDLLETASAVLPKGVFKVVMAAMANAHLQAYDIIHDNSKKTAKRAKVGVAHHVSFMRPYGLFDVPLAIFSDWMTRFAIIDDIAEKLDYIGLNYYGQEVLSAPGLKLVEEDEYSESGRGVYPDGLYRVLIDFHNRYKKFSLPFIITENGVSDSSDYIRRPYITEHLLAIRAAMAKGVPVQGYCFWTTSDNWEWADGYGPKFGLVAVDRHRNLARTPRPSYHLFSEIAKTGVVTKKQRDQAWEDLQTAIAEGKKRPFCRAVDSNGLMYSGGLDIPIELPFATKDWRFGHYKMDGLQDPISRFIRFTLYGGFLGRKHSSTTRSKAPSSGPGGIQYKAVPDERLTEVEDTPALA